MYYKNLSWFSICNVVIILILLTGITCCQRKSHSDNRHSISFVEPTNPYIQYVGRIDFSNLGQPRFSAPGVYITANFKGTACSVLFQDEFASGNRNYFDAIIDDTLFVKIAPEKGVNEYLVASNLESKDHKIVFVKRTEASIGKTIFLGFKFIGEITQPPAMPERKMEFIGNPISAGYGGDAFINTSSCKEDGWGQPYHNAYLSFPGRVARSLNARYHITAVSGIGLVRNWSDEYDGRNMRQVYQNLFLEDKNSPTWEHEKFIPDATVNELGTNDFSLGATPRSKMDTASISSAYFKFIDRLRTLYPNAYIFCVSSPMLSDQFPDPDDRFSSDLKGVLNNLQEFYKKKGDNKVYAITVNKIEAQGCDSHPSSAQQEIIANEVQKFIKPILNW